MMNQSIKLHLEHLKRSFYTVPPLRSLGCYINGPEPQKQFFEAFGFGLRFDGNPAGKQFEINGKKYSVREYPYVMLKRPGTWHETSSAIYYSYLFFSYPKTMTEALVKLGFTDDFVCCELPRKTAFYEIFREIQTEARHLDEFGTIDRIDMLCWRLVQEFLLVYHKKENPLPASSRKILKIVAWLQLNLKKPIHWESLARQHGLSYRSFLRQWKQAGLPPPNRYLMDLRMEEAKRLLEQTNMPVADIADELLYCCSAWFCSAFRRVNGETPLQYRRKFQG